MTVTPQTNTTLEEIADVLRRADSVIITGHVSPDGDCIGSQLALSHALKSLGKKVTGLLAENSPVDETLSYLPGASELIVAPEEVLTADAFVAVDVPTHERMGRAARHHQACSCTITIDHHAVDDRVSDYTYVDPDVAATTMLIWRLAHLLNDAIPREVSQCCYTGLLTDTGGFQFQNADYDAFATAADMVAAGADPVISAQHAYQSISLATMRLSSIAIDRAVFVREGAGVVSWITEKDMARYGACKADLDPLIDTLRSIRGVRIACIVREQDGAIRGSLRAKDATDVSAIARRHNGGGHVAASGFRMEGAIEDAVSTMAAELEAALS